MVLIVVLAFVVATIIAPRSMHLSGGRQLCWRRRDRVEQIVISVYNFVLVVSIYVWIDLTLHFLASLAQPFYLEAGICPAIRYYCLAQRIKSAYPILVPTVAIGWIVLCSVGFRSLGVSGADSRDPLSGVWLVFSDHPHLPLGLCPDVIPQLVTIFDSEKS